MLKCKDELQRSKAESIRGTYHGMEVFCLVFKAIAIYVCFWGCERIQKEQESDVGFCHLTTYTQCKPNLFNLSLIQNRKKEKKLNTQTFTTWQFSLQTQYNYTHIIPVWLCFFKLKRIQRQAQVKTNHPPPQYPHSLIFINQTFHEPASSVSFCLCRSVLGCQ